MVQSWKAHEGTQKYADLGAHHVMKITDEERAAASAEEGALEGIGRLVNVELDRQKWRGEMCRSPSWKFCVSRVGDAGLLRRTSMVG